MRPHHQGVRPDDVIDLAREPHPAAAQYQQVVTDPVELGEQVRRQHDGGAVLGGLGQQQCGEPVPGDRVEPGQRLVEEEEFGAPGEGQGEPEAGALPAGEGAARASRGSRPSRTIRSAHAPFQRPGLSARPIRSVSATVSRG